MSVFVIRFADLELGDLEGHLPHAAHWDSVASRREQQEFLLEALAVVLQNLHMKSVIGKQSWLQPWTN
jgi:hypothetical protein